MRMKWFVAVSVVALAAGGALSPSFAIGAGPYTIVDLGTLGGPFSSPEAISNEAMVVGTTQNVGEELRAFVWDDGHMTDLSALFPHYESIDAMGVNSSGQVVGSSSYGGAFVWTEQSGVSYLGGPADSSTYATDINDSGEATGSYWVSGMEGLNACLWDSAGLTNLGTLGGQVSTGVAINNSAWVVGDSDISRNGPHHAFLWKDGVMTDLGTLGGQYSNAYDVNDQGIVVGNAHDSGGTFRAFTWHAGLMTELPGSHATARGINSSGQAVGDALVGGRHHASLWEAGVWSDLNDLIPADSGWELIIAHDINDSGWIVGSGVAPDLHTRAFLLIPEPVTLGLLALGGIAVIRRRRK